MKPRPSIANPAGLLGLAGIALIAPTVLVACAADGGREARTTTSGTQEGTAKVSKSEQEWQARLTPEQYRITRQQGTERPFTGAYWNEKTVGIYACICCGQPLFDSSDKFDSATGWPSFTRPTAGGHVAQEMDRSLGMLRNEVHCSRCDAHLGHVFDDGPAPTGLRYCINSASLDLVPRPDAAQDAGKRE